MHTQAKTFTPRTRTRTHTHTHSETHGHTPDNAHTHTNKHTHTRTCAHALAPCSVGDYYITQSVFLASGPVAQWMKHWLTEPGIAGSSAAGVM